MQLRLRRAASGSSADDLAVLENQEIVRDRDELAEEVRHEHERRLSAHALDEREEELSLVLGESRGRLVEQQHRMLYPEQLGERERAHDLDELSLVELVRPE